MIVLVSGCIIKSIHPFYTDETKIDFSRINGDWKSITQLGDNVEKKGIFAWTFNAKSITLGGRGTSTLTVEDFIYGTIAPSATSDTAFWNRSGGKIVLNKVGKVTIRGTYKDSEDTPTPEPSFLFWAE